MFNATEKHAKEAEKIAAKLAAEAEASPEVPLPSPAGYEPKPWDRLPTETAEAYIWFSAYRDMLKMGYEKRSMRKLWEIMNPGKTIKMNGTLYNWSTKHKWGERCEAYDIEMVAETTRIVKKLQSDEANRISRNQTVFKDNLVYLSQQALQKSAEILAIPTVKRSFLEMKDGKTIIHKPHVLSPGHLMAAAALAKMGMELGRFGLGLKDDDGDNISPEQFRKLFYKTTGEAVKELPQGALPPPPKDPNSNPNVQAPIDSNGSVIPSEALQGENTPMPPPEIHKFKPARERP